MAAVARCVGHNVAKAREETDIAQRNKGLNLQFGRERNKQIVCRLQVGASFKESVHMKSVFHMNEAMQQTLLQREKREGSEGPFRG